MKEVNSLSKPTRYLKVEYTSFPEIGVQISFLYFFLSFNNILYEVMEEKKQSRPSMYSR